jgi:hypothetical protein
MRLRCYLDWAVMADTGPRHGCRMRTESGSVGERLLLQKDTRFSPRCTDEYEVKGVAGKDREPDQVECYLECEDGQVSFQGRVLDHMAMAWLAMTVTGIHGRAPQSGCRGAGSGRAERKRRCPGDIFCRWSEDGGTFFGEGTVGRGDV